MKKMIMMLLISMLLMYTSIGFCDIISEAQTKVDETKHASLVIKAEKLLTEKENLIEKLKSIDFKLETLNSGEDVNINDIINECSNCVYFSN